MPAKSRKANHIVSLLRQQHGAGALDFALQKLAYFQVQRPDNLAADAWRDVVSELRSGGQQAGG